MKHHRKPSDYCEQTGKRRFRDAREATRGLQNLRNRARALDEAGREHKIRVERKYSCSACRGWHLTSWKEYSAPAEDSAKSAPDALVASLAKSTGLGASPVQPQGAQRALDMCRRRAQGQTLQEIADTYGLTRERVRQIIASAGGPTRSEVRAFRASRQERLDAQDAETLRRLMREHPGRTRAELAEMSGIAANRIGALLGDDVRLLVTPQTARRQFEDDDIFRALREAAAMVDKPLSQQRYATVSREVGGPSPMRIIQRFGSWLKACEAAGIRGGRKPRREYARKWTNAQILTWVVTYLQAPGSDGTFAGYDAWARETEGAPSSGTMRNVLGTWAGAKAAALLLLEAENRDAA